MSQTKYESNTFFQSKPIEKKKELTSLDANKSFNWNAVLDLAIAGAKLGFVSGFIAGTIAGTVAGGILGWGSGGVVGAFVWLNIGGAVGAVAGMLAGAIIGFALMGLLGIALAGYDYCKANSTPEQKTTESPAYT